MYLQDNKFINSNPSLLDAILDGTSDDIVERYLSLPSLAEATNFGEYDSNIVVLDTETTGTSYKKDELIQIAAARLDGGQIVDWLISYVNPNMPIPEEITLLTGIKDDDVCDAPSPDSALHDLVEFVQNSKIVAHNAYFDKNFLTKHPAGYPLLQNEWIDSLELSRIALPRLKSHRLIDLVKAFGCSLSTHRADEDVVATCELYRLLLAAISLIPKELTNLIATWYDPDKWPFGKIFTHFSQAETTTFVLQNFRHRRIDSLNNPKDVRLDAKYLLTPDADNEHNTSKGIVFPTDSEVEGAFKQEGLLGHIFPGFERRMSQIQMALAVGHAFESSTNLAVEAGTGTGKSLAYLVPSALLAVKNNITVGVATKTNALLDQLVYKDLPALSKGLMALGYTDRPLDVAPLKGFVHYPCLLRIQRIQLQGPKVQNSGGETKSQAPALAALLSFIEQTNYDDIDSLKIDYQVLPRTAITTPSSECLRKRCPFFGKECFVFGSRQVAECADIIVTNHSLLFYDVGLENTLLPPIRYWIVDEAHNVEEDARKALSITLSLDDLDVINKRLRSDDPRVNVLQAAQTAIEDGATFIERLVLKAKGAAFDFGENLDKFKSATKGLLYFDTQKKSSYDTFDLWINEEVRSSEHFRAAKDAALALAASMEKECNVLQDIVALLDDESNAKNTQRQLASVALELKNAIIATSIIFERTSDVYVYSVTLNRHEAKGKNRKGSNCYQAQLYNVGETLDKTFYTNTCSVVYTSATLAVGGSFASFEESVGLNCSADSASNTLTLEPCFNFDENMQIFILNDIDEPNNPNYILQLKEFLKEFHVAQNGSVLTLFTNKRDMDKTFEDVSDHLKQHNLRVASQRKGTSIKGLRDEFISNQSLSLFALKSFWEGFDAPGKTLRSVVVPRLPFGNPNDPLSLERNYRDDYAWKKYDLPKAVIELRQAAGRLIRKSDDKGVLVLCDSRLITKGYGKVFIKSLPSKNIHILSAKDVISKLLS